MSIKRKYQRLPPSIWAEICAEWEIGDVTLDELASRFGVNTRTLQAHFSKNTVTKGSKAAMVASAVKEELFERELEGKDDLVKRAKDTRESAYKNAVAVENLIMAQLNLVQKDPSQAYKAASAVKLLSLAAAGLERLHTLKWSALGLDRDAGVSNEMPLLIFRDLSEQEIKAIQRGTGSEDDPDEEPVQDDCPDPGLTPTMNNWDHEENDEIVEYDDAPALVKALTDGDGCRLVRDAQPKPIIPSKSDPAS
jgi:AcrR family transcriptional regulator